MGNVYKFIGMNGLCFDIPNYSKEHGASLQLWRCHGEFEPEIRSAARVGPYLRRKNVEGSILLREFDLAEANPKLCQRSCIDDRQCAAWDYRKPEGRTSNKPHCWLVTQVKERTQGDPMTISGSVRAEAPK